MTLNGYVLIVVISGLYRLNTKQKNGSGGQAVGVGHREQDGCSKVHLHSKDRRRVYRCVQGYSTEDGAIYCRVWGGILNSFLVEKHKAFFT